jgi:hypothetical protein
MRYPAQALAIHGEQSLGARQEKSISHEESLPLFESLFKGSSLASRKSAELHEFRFKG